MLAIIFLGFGLETEALKEPALADGEDFLVGIGFIVTKKGNVEKSAINTNTNEWREENKFINPMVKIIFAIISLQDCKLKWEM